MSFGFGVGDIIKALELANKVRTRFVDAPEQFKAISDEVRSLAIILDDIRLVLPQRDLTSEQRNNLNYKHGLTPLSMAAGNGHEAVVKLLLATNGIDPDFKDKDGWTPLSWAAALKQQFYLSKYEAIVELLIANNRVNVNARDAYGRTPLSWTAGHGNDEMVKLLLATNGIDWDSEDNEGHTPLWWATQGGHKHVIKLLTARASGYLSPS